METKNGVTQPLVKSIGCAFCWARHFVPFTRRCGLPGWINRVL